jgi:site-specific DNA-adenine methylase
MPSYGGGKAKLGKEITEVIQEIEENENWYGDFFEPFCGLLGVGIYIIKKNRKFICVSDLIKYVTKSIYTQLFIFNHFF